MIFETLESLERGGLLGERWRGLGQMLVGINLQRVWVGDRFLLVYWRMRHIIGHDGLI